MESVMPPQVARVTEISADSDMGSPRRHPAGRRPHEHDAAVRARHLDQEEQRLGSQDRLVVGHHGNMLVTFVLDE